MLPNWPNTKQEAYKYTDLSKAGSLALPHAVIAGQDLWPRELTQSAQMLSGCPAGHAASQHKIRVPRGAELVLTETITSAAVGVGVAHQQLTIELEEGARLTHIRRQTIDTSAFHWGQTFIKLARDAAYQHIALHTGGALARHEISVECMGVGADFEILALQLLGSGQHGDITTTIGHQVPHTRSNQLIKSVLVGDARGVFQGQIRVAPQAQKTNSQQQSRALLLSPQAEMNTKPELEIFADDVICSHGAATGALDDMQLFYLQSRGLSRAAAQGLLIGGFMTDVFDQVRDETQRTALQQEAEQWLAQLS